MPAKLRFLFDIVNIGLSGITLHDYELVDMESGQVKQVVALFPESHGHLAEYPPIEENISFVEHPTRCHLGAKERTTEMFDFPWDGAVLKEGQYVVGIRVRAGWPEKPKARAVVRLSVASKGKGAVITWR